MKSRINGACEGEDASSPSGSDENVETMLAAHALHFITSLDLVFEYSVAAQIV